MEVAAHLSKEEAGLLADLVRSRLLPADTYRVVTEPSQGR